MLTLEQKRWIAHLSTEERIHIVPFDPTAEEKFHQIKRRIHTALGVKVPIEHRGATSLRISGQDEIDVYVPVPERRFNEYCDKFKRIFGDPRSLYPFERARFVTQQDGKHVDVFLINKERDGWKNLEIIETYLRSHPEALEGYRKLKERGDGLSVREYYLRKTEYINGILFEARHAL